MRELDPRICRCPCHRDGDEDHHECCFSVAAIERDAAEAKLEDMMAQRDSGTLELLAENERHAATSAKLARCVEALLEIKGRALASQTHEIGPLEAKERLAAVLVSARAALAAAKGE